MGVAVADDGHRVFLVGGRAQIEIGIPHPCIGRDGTSAPWISAEIFELNLGDKGGGPLQWDAWWRQVTPTRKGAKWPLSRASPACHLFNLEGVEHIFCVGGEITTSGVTTKPTASAFIIKLDPCPPASSFKSVHEETLQARLKELSKGKGVQGADPVQQSAHTDTRRAELVQNGTKWPPERLLLADLRQVARPQDDLQGFYSTTGSIHFYRPEENLLKTTAQPFPFQYKGVHPSSSPTCSAFYGPESCHLGVYEIADLLGCCWLGVVNWVAEERDFVYTKVVRVFGTGLAASTYFAKTYHTYSLGMYQNFQESSEFKSWSIHEKQRLLSLLGLVSEISIQVSTTTSSENKGRFRHLLIHVCVGRLWAKIYCRQNAEENKGGRLVISTLCHLVADFEEFLQRQNYQCSRCQRMGRASQVCSGCEAVRFCPGCGNAAWREGHSKVCRRNPPNPEHLDEDILFLPEEMESVSLAAFLRGTRLATSDQNMLAKFCLQAAHFYPWAVVLVLDSGQQTSDLDFGKSFWFCARDLRCGLLLSYLEEVCDPNIVCEARLGSSWESGSFDHSRLLGEVVGQGKEPFYFLHYRQIE